MSWLDDVWGFAERYAIELTEGWSNLESENDEAFKEFIIQAMGWFEQGVEQGQQDVIDDPGSFMEPSYNEGYD